MVFPNVAAQNSFALALLDRLGPNLKKLLLRNHAPKKKRAVPKERIPDFLALDLDGTLLAKVVDPVLSAVVQAQDMVASTTETALSVTSSEVVAVALLLLLRSRMTAQSESKVATLEILKSQSLRKKKLSKKLLPKLLRRKLPSPSQSLRSPSTRSQSTSPSPSTRSQSTWSPCQSTSPSPSTRSQSTSPSPSQSTRSQSLRNQSLRSLWKRRHLHLKSPGDNAATDTLEPSVTNFSRMTRSLTG